MRDNGAIEGAADGFEADDEVIVMQHKDLSIIKVIGHVDGVKHCGKYIVYTISAIQTRCIVWNVKKAEALTWDSGQIILPTAPDFVTWKTGRTDLAKSLFTNTHRDTGESPSPYGAFYFAPNAGFDGHKNGVLGDIFPKSLWYNSPLNIANQNPGFRTGLDPNVISLSGTIEYSGSATQYWYSNWNGSYFATVTNTVTLLFISDSLVDPVYTTLDQIQAVIRAMYPPDELIPGVSQYRCQVEAGGSGYYKRTQHKIYQFFDVLGKIGDDVETEDYTEGWLAQPSAIYNETVVCPTITDFLPGATGDKKSVFEQLSFSYKNSGAYIDSIITQISIVQVRPHTYNQTYGYNKEWVDLPNTETYVLGSRSIFVTAMAHYDSSKTIETTEFDWSTMTTRNSTLIGLIQAAIIEAYNGETQIEPIGVIINIY